MRGQIILDYLGAANVITRVHISERRAGVNVRVMHDDTDPTSHRWL